MLLSPPNRLNIRWRRGRSEITYDRPSVWFALGRRGSGKSTFLETVGEGYLGNGHGLLDLFGSRDGEALAWLRSPWAKSSEILLLHGENVDVDCSYPTKTVNELQLSDFEKYDLVISASPLYLNIDQEFADAAKIEDLLYKRMHYKKLVYLCCREASNFYYSRLKVSDNQLYAKAQMVYLIRESRHMGIALGLDSIRSYAIDIDIRSLSDNLILKAQGVQGLSKDLKWLYRYVEPHALRNLAPNRFVIVTSSGSIGFGVFPEVSWHKQEREDIMANVGVVPEYGEIPKEGVLKGSYRTVGDVEHAKIITQYIESGFGMSKLGTELGRSSRTISIHVGSHNDQVERTGTCPACQRVQSAYLQTLALGKASRESAGHQ